MNQINFQQVGGFPLETNTLTEVQKAYSIFNAFGGLAGNKTIISGCEVQGKEITNGYIYLDGELLEFKGGIKQDTIVIVQEDVKVAFEDKTVKPVYFTRYATFGVSGNAIPWNDFKRFYINQPMYKETKWVGTGVTQADLQRGWFIADGKNDTDNILGRSIVGVDPGQSEFNTVGKTGGKKTHQLTIAEMPRHNLKLKIPAVSFEGEASGSGNGGDGTATRVTETNYIGKDKPHNILSPYIVQTPIQFIGG